MSSTGRQQQRDPEEPLHHGDGQDASATAGDTVTADDDVRDGHDYTADPDSGRFGVGSNAGEGNDDLERETTPGFQADKWERGTIMPR